MKKQTNNFLFIITLAFLVACVGPTTQRVKPNDAAIAIEAEKQREIAIKEALKSQNRLLRVGAPILKNSLASIKLEIYYLIIFKSLLQVTTN